MDHQFRNAAFGGFNKKDVLDYLELMSQENAQQLQNLQQQLDQAQTQCSQLSDRNVGQAARVEWLQGENQRLEQESAQLRAQLEQANEQSDALRAQLAQAQAAQKSLQEQVDKLQPDAAAYAAVKDRAAGVELDAHRRAQHVLDEAQDQAQQLRRQMEQWLQKVQREYDALRTEVDSTVSHAANQLEKAGASLQKVSALMDQQDMALEALAQAYTNSDQPKVSAPMPIPEE